MQTDPEPLLAKLRCDRLREMLDDLARQGLSQSQVAARANVPTQYLSDVKNGRRSFTELFARRLGEEFGTDYMWLLGGGTSSETPRFRVGGARAANSPVSCIPVLFKLIEGDPRLAPSWDGSVVEIAGAAAAKIASANLPYVLRFGGQDRRARLQTDDLVLIAQRPNHDARIHVVKTRATLLLARQSVKSTWEPVTGQRLSGKTPEIIGHCVSIIWGSL